MKKILYLFFIFFLLAVAFMMGLGAGFIFDDDDGFKAGDKVALLSVEDVILDSKVYLESITSIKKDKDIKALVLRINSPGGAVGPSQEIYSEILKLREKIPVIASLGAVAASGGYYIACGADKILTNPGTVTGSIGVIAQFVNYKELLEWAKVDVEVLKSGKFKDSGSPLKDLTPEERAYLQSTIDDVHNQFKKAVGDTRKLKPEEVNAIADGRIFTGQQAVDLKLVDEIGTMNDAIDAAAKLGGIEGEPNVTHYPKKKTRLVDVLSNIESNVIPKIPFNSRFGLFYLVNTI
ncbi:MAG TPA: signal peptide peptidase SppA [Thermodesulfobacteriota bacterium]|nr:signal peptide peptidase SppA [Thermodesulfobacteriota bacterium]